MCWSNRTGGQINNNVFVTEIYDSECNLLFTRLDWNDDVPKHR